MQTNYRQEVRRIDRNADRLQTGSGRRKGRHADRKVDGQVDKQTYYRNEGTRIDRHAC